MQDLRGTKGVLDLKDVVNFTPLPETNPAIFAPEKWMVGSDELLGSMLVSRVVGIFFVGLGLVWNVRFFSGDMLISGSFLLGLPCFQGGTVSLRRCTSS